MGQYRNGKWEPTFGDVQAGVSDYAPGERTPEQALSIKDRRIAELEAERDRLRDALLPVPAHMDARQLEEWFDTYRAKRNKTLEETT